MSGATGDMHMSKGARQRRVLGVRYELAATGCLENLTVHGPEIHLWQSSPCLLFVQQHIGTLARRPRKGPSGLVRGGSEELVSRRLGRCRLCRSAGGEGNAP